MRWERLFADLAGQLDAARTLELDSAVADLTRAEAATIALEDRLRAVVGRSLQLLLVGGIDLQGELREVAPEWLLVAVSGREVVVAASAVDSVRGLGARAAPGAAGSEAGVHVRALGLGHVLRGIARDRTVVRVRTAHREHVGRINRVGKDHLDLVAVPLDGRADRAGQGDVVVVRFASVVHVSST
jgi:hypothetical protein